MYRHVIDHRGIRVDFQWMHQPRRIKHQAIFLTLFEYAFKDVYRANKFGAIAGSRMLVDLFRFANLDKFPTIHNGDAPRHGHRLFLIVSNHHAGHTDALQNIHHFKLHPVTQFFIQRAHRFVEQQKFWALGKASGQRHTLSLTAGKLMRFAFGELLHMHQPKHLVDPAGNFRFR